MKNAFYILGLLAAVYGGIVGIVKLLTSVPLFSGLYVCLFGMVLIGIGNILENQQKILKILKNNNQ